MSLQKTLYVIRGAAHEQRALADQCVHVPKLKASSLQNAADMDAAAQYVEKMEAENAQLRALLGPALRDSERLAWLHRAGPNDATGCEWGIFRVLWDGNGQPVAVSQTLSDFSDLDAEMKRNP